MMAWKSADGKAEASRLVSQLEVLIQGMLNRETLMDLVRSFTVFEKTKTEDLKTKITKIETVKKVAAYHQYYAVNKAIESTIRATMRWISASDGTSSLITTRFLRQLSSTTASGRASSSPGKTGKRYIRILRKRLRSQRFYRWSASKEKVFLIH
jgi:hypothetical protein